LRLVFSLTKRERKGKAMEKGMIKIGWIALALIELAFLTLPFRAAILPPALKVIKSLVGDWVELSPQGKVGSNIVSSYALTSGGTAIREVIFPGSDHEMITMYSLEGDDVLLTHFCILGNTPKYRAKLQGDNRLVYECLGGANISSENDKHMHRGSVKIVDPDHLQTEWLQFENGKETYKVSLNLVRKK